MRIVEPRFGGKFSPKELESLTCADDGVQLRESGDFQGKVKVTAKGVSVYFGFRYSVDGKQREKHLGAFPRTGIAEIRRKYNELKGLVAQGLDPIEEEKTRREQMLQQRLEKKKAEQEAIRIRKAEQERISNLKTMNALFNAWDESQGALLNDHWREVLRSLWRCHIEPYVGASFVENASDIELIKHITVLNTNGQLLTAKRTLAFTKQVLKWGKSLKWVAATHPILAIEPIKQTVKLVRDEQQPENFDIQEYLAKHGEEVIGDDQHEDRAGRALRINEITLLLSQKLFASTQSDTGKAIIRFVLATGVRTIQAIRIRWKWVDIGRRLIIFPAGAMKSRRMHHVHLSDYALAQLKAMHAIQSNEFVFPAPIKTNSPVLRSNVGTDIACRQFYRSSDESDAEYAERVKVRRANRRGLSEFDCYNLPGGKWTLYDLRRSAATALQSLGVDYGLIINVMSHAAPESHGVTSLYAREKDIKWLARCKALDNLGQLLMECEAGKLHHVEAGRLVVSAELIGL